jgi:non-specific protein-tyrosine kinase
MEKLRKALEKAKLERQDEQEAMTGQGAGNGPQATAAAEAADGAGVAAGAGVSAGRVAAEINDAAAEASELEMARPAPVYRHSRVQKLSQEELARNRCLSTFSDHSEIEAYKMLRTHVMQRASSSGWNTIMITSALPGEGKTLTAVNLALTFAKEYNHTVLLVDCDLRKQSVHKMLGIDSKLGLIDALIDNRPLSELIVWPGIEKLTVISGERTISDTSEMLSSAKMKALVTEIKNRYPDRYVIFDLPPLLTITDAVAFSPLVDAILMVVQAEKTSIQDIKKAAGMIPGDKFLGFVLNKYHAPSKEFYETYYAKAG